MNSELKDEWVAALESGEYQQTQGVLTKIQGGQAVGHCCLGVLADICVSKSEYDVMADGTERPGDFYYKFGGVGRSGSIPTKWAEANLGINVNQQSDLIEMNDQEGYNFDEIAKYIRENL